MRHRGGFGAVSKTGVPRLGESCVSLVWAVLDLQINTACNGVKLSDIDRHKLYRLRHEPGESEAEPEEVVAA